MGHDRDGRDDGARDLSILDRHIAQLAEHYDTVVIVASRYEGGPNGSTTTCKRAIGNWYTQHGLIREWIIAREQQVRDDARRRDDDDDGDEDED